MISPTWRQTMLGGIEAKIAAASRPDFEQAILRVVLAATILGYVAWYSARDGAISRDEDQALLIVAVFFVFACAVAVADVFARRISKAARILGIVVDNSIVTYAMIGMGEGGAIVSGVYLFIALGNGFRYGRLYLYLSQCLSIAGFALVISSTPFWSQHTAPAAGSMIILLVIPLYVDALARRLLLSRRRAEDALQAMQNKSG